MPGEYPILESLAEGEAAVKKPEGCGTWYGYKHPTRRFFVWFRIWDNPRPQILAKHHSYPSQQLHVTVGMTCCSV